MTKSHFSNRIPKDNNYIITQNEKVPYGCVALSAQQRKDINIPVSNKLTPSYIDIL